MFRLDNVVFAIVAALALTSSAHARNLDWPQLREALTGKSVTVRLREGAALQGKVRSVSADALMLDSRSIACTEIAAVETRGKSRRALWAVVGAAAGLAAGAALGTRFSNEGNDGAAAGLAGGLAGAGAALGYAAGGKGKVQTLTLEPGACGAGAD